MCNFIANTLNSAWNAFNTIVDKVESASQCYSASLKEEEERTWAQSLLPHGGRVSEVQGIIPAQDKDFLIDDYMERTGLSDRSLVEGTMSYPTLLKLYEENAQVNYQHRIDVPLELLTDALENYDVIEIREGGKYLVLENTPLKAVWLQYGKNLETNKWEYREITKQTAVSTRVY